MVQGLGLDSIRKFRNPIIPGATPRSLLKLPNVGVDLDRRMLACLTHAHGICGGTDNSRTLNDSTE